MSAALIVGATGMIGEIILKHAFAAFPPASLRAHMI